MEALLGAGVTRACLGVRQSSSSRNVSQARGHSLGCLPQGPLMWKWVSRLCLRSMWTEGLLVTMRFLRTQMGNGRIWSDWKCNGLLHLVVLLMDQRRLSGSFCLNSLDIFLWNLWKWTGRTGPRSLRTKITFSSLANPSAITYIGVVTLRRDILAAVYPFMTHHFYHGQDYTQECAQTNIRWMLPLLVLAWETFWENYSGPPRVASKEKGKSKKGLRGMQLNQFEMPSGLPLLHLRPTSMVEPEGTSLAPASIRDRLSLTREGKLWWKVCLHPYLEQRGMKIGETNL